MFDLRRDCPSAVPILSLLTLNLSYPSTPVSSSSSSPSSSSCTPRSVVSLAVSPRLHYRIVSSLVTPSPSLSSPLSSHPRLSLALPTSQSLILTPTALTASCDTSDAFTPSCLALSLATPRLPFHHNPYLLSHLSLHNCRPNLSAFTPLHTGGRPLFTQQAH